MPEKKFRIGIVSRLKHGDILEAINSRGWTQSKAAEFLGMSPQQFGGLINLQWVPKKISPELEKKLLELTGKLPEDLWPDFVREKLSKKRPQIFINLAEVSPRMLEAKEEILQLPPIQEEQLQQKELQELFEDIFKYFFSSGQEKILRMRFYEEKTLEEIAEHFQMSRENVRRIIFKLLRRVRNSKAFREKLRAHIS